MKNLKKIISVSLIMILALSLCLTGCSGKKGKKGNKTEKHTPVNLNGEYSEEKKYSINLYYTDSTMWSGLNAAYQKLKTEYDNITVNFKYTDNMSYIEKLVGYNSDKKVIADVYVLPMENLEQAYLAGITTNNTNSEYNADNYPQRSLDACSYNGKLIGYPYTINSQVMLCNMSFQTRTPKTFEELKQLSSSIEVPEGKVLEHVLAWDASDMNVNYNFIGNSALICGHNGNDKSNIDINNEATKKSMSYFKDLSVFYSINRKSINKEKLIESYAQGRTMFALVNSSDIKAIEDFETSNTVSTNIVEIPSIDDVTSCVGLATTTGLVVNPYSSNRAVAEIVAKYFSYDAADVVYKNTGNFSAKLLDKSATYKYQAVYASYERSVNKISLMNIDDLYIKLDIAFHNVMEGQDIATVLSDFEAYVKKVVQ